MPVAEAAPVMMLTVGFDGVTVVPLAGAAELVTGAGVADGQ
jgi:hypothetical protein